MVRDILQQHVPHLEVRAFGSRAGEKPKPFSDLDLMVLTRQPIDVRRWALLAEAFSESDLPFKVDVLDSSAIPSSFRERLLRGSIIVQQSEAEL
jgi:type I restriction enzyme S subunit